MAERNPSSGIEHTNVDHEYIASDQREVKNLRRLAHVLDSSIPLPGGFRIGLDGIIGLVPFVGDAVGATLSSYIVIRAAQLGVSVPLLMRMMLNVVIEAVIGIIPVLGDIFDFAWKANQRNINLLNQTLPDMQMRSAGAKRRLTTAVVVLLSLFVLALILLVVIAIKLFMVLIAAIAG